MSPASNQYIDGLILSTAVSQWRKSHSLSRQCSRYATTMGSDQRLRHSGRIRALVDEGKLEAQGNLSRWLHSEVRLPE